MSRKSKGVEKTRLKDEFDLARLQASISPPIRTTGAFAWDLDAIRSARSSLQAGYFGPAVRLLRSVKTDAAIYTAFLNRLAPIGGLPCSLEVANDTTRAKRIRDEGEPTFGRKGAAVSAATLKDINENLAALGVAIAYTVVTPRADGSRWDIEVRAWPMEFVRWDATRKVYTTWTEDRGIVDIVHGDGTWIVFRQHEIEPWSWGALVALALIWADRAYGIRDRSKAGTSHGNAKIVGELPEGVALLDGDGALTAEAAAFLELLKGMHGELPAGIRPAKSKTEMLVNTSQAWQIFNEIIKGNDVDASRVLLGSDVATKTEGGDYKKSSFLWGVRNDIVEDDLGAIATGIKEGAIDVWAAINFGDSQNAPERVWLFPDPDEAARREQFAAGMAFVVRDVKALRDTGFDVTQETVDELCKRYGVPRLVLKPVEPAKLEPQPAPAPATPALPAARSSRNAA
jgi:uncharacterized protein DUF935